MGQKKKIDVTKAIEMRVFGKNLKEIGDAFGATGEAVRQALDNAQKKKERQKEWARLLVSSTTPIESIDSREKKPDAAEKIIDDWISILQTIKKVTSLEAQITLLNARITKLENEIAKPLETKGQT
jgi:hypothetical protein